MIKNKINLIWLIATLSAIFIGCKEDDLSVGSDFQNEDGTFTKFAINEKDLNIEYSTVLDNDSLNTFNSDIITVGKHLENTVSTVDANSFVQVGLSSENKDFGINPICDSIILFLRFQDDNPINRYYQGTGITEINVKEMTEFFGEDQLFNSQSYNASTDIVGNLSFDGTIPLVGIGIDLSTDFGNKLITETQDRSSEDFLTSFAGLALEAGNSSTMISSFNASNTSSIIRLYYHNDDENSQYDYNIGNGLNEHVQLVSSFTGDFSPLTTDGDILLSSSSNNNVALSSGVGLNTLISFKDLSSALDTLGNVVVNRAIIELPINEALFVEFQDEAPAVFNLFEADSLGNILENEDGSQKQIRPYIDFVIGGGSGLFTLSDDDVKYEIDITQYFQSIILKEQNLNSLLLTTNLIDLSGRFYNARYRRTTISTDDIKFQIIYSKI